MDDDMNLDITDSTNFDIDENEKAIIKVIGVGGGGCNTVNYMYNQNIPLIKFVVCNTDQQALKLSPVPTKILIGKEITDGRGAGNMPEVGKACAKMARRWCSSLPVWVVAPAPAPAPWWLA